MKKMIKPIPALLLIIMVVIVLMKINRTWALNQMQNPNVEYFISKIDFDTTYEDLEREIGPVTGSIGSGFVRVYYKAEDLFFLDYWMNALSEKGIVADFMVEDMSGNYRGLIMYIEKNFKSTEYIKKLFSEKKIISDSNKYRNKAKTIF